MEGSLLRSPSPFLIYLNVFFGFKQTKVSDHYERRYHSCLSTRGTIFKSDGKKLPETKFSTVFTATVHFY